MGFDRQAWRKKALEQKHPQEQPTDPSQVSPPDPFIRTISDEQWKLIIPYLAFAISQRLGYLDQGGFPPISPEQVPEVLLLVINQVGCPPISQDQAPEVISILSHLALDLIMKTDTGKKGPFKTYKSLLLKSKILEVFPEANRIFQAIKSVGFTFRSEPADLERAALTKYDENPGSFNLISRHMLENISYDFSGGQERRDFFLRIFQQIMSGKSSKEAIKKALKELS